MPAANTNISGVPDALGPRQKRKIVGPALGSAFDPADRLFPSYGHGGVFDTNFAEARDLHEMLAKDGKARAIEQVLTMPIRGADHEITGPNKEFVEENIPNLDLIIDQMTSAVVYRKAFFEKVWKLDGGNVVYDKIAFRPAVGCSAWYDEDTGDLKGFRQRIRLNLNLQKNGLPRRNMAWARNQNRGYNRVKDEPGWVYVPIEKSFIYVHGLHRDPVRGISDLDVSYWAYENRKKVMFLWFQFLENSALPKTVVYGDDQDEANELAAHFAQVRSAGAMGLKRNPEGQPSFETIDSAGAGAAQFEAALQYLESLMTQSVLASFMDLSSSANSGTGSYALSADQSEFFLKSRQAVADEIAQCINRNLFGPLIHYNYGDVELPKIEIGPLSDQTTERALNLLTAIIAAPQVNVPMDFVGQLVTHTAGFLGLDEQEVEGQVREYAAKRKADDEEMRRLQIKQMSQPPVIAQAGAAQTGNAQREKPKKAQAKQLSLDSDVSPELLRDAIDAAYDLVTLAEQGYDPKDLLI